jgi:hypothetical protein
MSPYPEPDGPNQSTHSHPISLRFILVKNTHNNALGASSSVWEKADAEVQYLTNFHDAGSVFEKLIFAQVVKNCSTFYGSQRCITRFIRIPPPLLNPIMKKMKPVPRLTPISLRTICMEPEEFTKHTSYFQKHRFTGQPSVTGINLY